jgi:23S rRNA (cytidine1920-2'-O)/16S rRNA (cytidine1409-2'-O)-methyltransferase
MLERGLAESRARAEAMILAGQVLVDDQRIDKAGQLVNADAEIRIKGEKLRYASRGGLKLEAALREFRVDPAGLECIDVGASTGGFTDCLLQHGASRVWAIDVGHNQIIWRLRKDPRIVVMEGLNARDLDPEMFSVKFDLATIDVSFISLAKILPALRRCMSDQGQCIALVKPQFEVGKGKVGKRGIVKDPAQHRRVLIEVAEAACRDRYVPLSVIESPILGAEGNREFLMHLICSETKEPRDRAIAEQIENLTSSSAIA